MASGIVQFSVIHPSSAANNLICSFKDITASIIAFATCLYGKPPVDWASFLGIGEGAALVRAGASTSGYTMDFTSRKFNVSLQ